MSVVREYFCFQWKLVILIANLVKFLSNLVICTVNLVIFTSNLVKPLLSHHNRLHELGIDDFHRSFINLVKSFINLVIPSINLVIFTCNLVIFTPNLVKPLISHQKTASTNGRRLYFYLELA